MALSGVRWPSASVLPHFGHRDRYLILDHRALEALWVTEPVIYTVPLWNAYVATGFSFGVQRRSKLLQHLPLAGLEGLQPGGLADR